MGAYVRASLLHGTLSMYTRVDWRLARCKAALMEAATAEGGRPNNCAMVWQCWCYIVSKVALLRMPVS